MVGGFTSSRRLSQLMHPASHSSVHGDTPRGRTWWLRNCCNTFGHFLASSVSETISGLGLYLSRSVDGHSVVDSYNALEYVTVIWQLPDAVRELVLGDYKEAFQLNHHVVLVSRSFAVYWHLHVVRSD